MYCNYFGLHSHPFKITPDTRKFFSGACRGAILNALKYSILSGEGIVKMVGEVGSGKTMLCRTLIHALPLSVEIAYLANPSLSRIEVLRAISQELGLANVSSSSGRLDLLNNLQHHLITLHGEGCRVVIIVEEAQGMPLETLEELRFLSNLETRNEKLLQILLIGQPELDERLANPDIRQLKDRITQNFSLPQLSADEVRDYIQFRLHAVGCPRVDLFSAPALRLLASHSKGLMRRLHIMADKSLLAAYADGVVRITRAHVRRAICDSEYARDGKSAMRRFLPAGVGLMFALMGLVSYAFTPVLKQGGQMSALAPSVQQQRKSPPSAPVVAIPAQQSAIAGHLGERIAETREWLYSKGEGYTIQVMLMNDLELAPLERLLQRTALEQLDQLYVYRTRVGGSERWGVVYGDYPDFGAARAALKEVPAQFQVYRPFIRSLHIIREEATQLLASTLRQGTGTPGHTFRGTGTPGEGS